MKIEKHGKLIWNFTNEINFAVHIINLKQTLHNGTILRELYIVNKNNHSSWL